jgi:hypothetical protein
VCARARARVCVRAFLLACMHLVVFFVRVLADEGKRVIVCVCVCVCVYVCVCK